MDQLINSFIWYLSHIINFAKLLTLDIKLLEDTYHSLY